MAAADAMAPRPGRQTLPAQAVWLPPKRRGRNLAVGDPLHYRHDGMNTTRLTGQGIPSAAELFKEYSIYYNRSTMWIVPLNAITTDVGDGIDGPPAPANPSDPREMDSDTDYNEEWTALSFTETRVGDAYAGWNLRSPHLLRMPADQPWPRMLLPDTYLVRSRGNLSLVGGLVGELPVLLGLLALSIPADRVRAAMPLLVKNPFVVSEIFGRAAGWQDRRGVVVTVYTDPRTSTYPGSTRENLKHVEQGGLGPIFI